MPSLQSNRPGGETQGPKLLERVRQRLQQKGFGLDVKNRYVEWCRQFILFHGKRHPQEMGAAEVSRFLEHLAGQKLSVRWQREACAAVGFLYREEIGKVVELPQVLREFPGEQRPAVPGQGSAARRHALLASLRRR